MTASFVRRLSAALVAFAFAPLALAHPEGHGAHDFVAGFAHPFTGIDHLLAMIAVGLWAVRLGRRAVWTLPIVFPLAMLIGAAAGANGIGLPAIEPMIAISVIVLGALVAAGLIGATTARAVLVGGFGVFLCHGAAVAAPAAAP
ncbi:MAG TPA: HupE/UreJ family protein, partial [Povalibacter sp.]|uniref:HupE/UreJ family protein n=1 Tax=Povalibacter sp. TaxID=1962978 RepID=UPI002C71E434